MNTRGSEWRKWDLHVHTPASLCSEYGGDNDEIWEQFIQRIENLPSDIKVLGINDYLFLDGYEKVLKYKKDGRIPNIELLLPVHLQTYCKKSIWPLNLNYSRKKYR